MSKKTNSTLIGAFVLGAIVLAIAAAVFFGSGRFLRDKETFVLYFDGSVNGLTVGSPVKFLGVQIGRVTKIDLELHTKDIQFRTPVFIETVKDIVRPIGDPKEAHPDLKAVAGAGDRLEVLKFLVRQGLRARLQLESLVTGQLFVELGMHPGTPVHLVLAYPGIKEIPTIPSQFQELAERLEKLPLDQLANETLKTLQSISQKVNSPEITEAIKDLSTALRDTRTLMQNVNRQVTNMASSLEHTLETARDALGEAKDMFAQGKKTLAFEDGATGRLAERTEETLASAKGALEEARETFKKAGDAATLVGSGVEGTSQEARAALKDARRLVRNVDRRVKTVVGGVEQTLRTVRGVLQQAEQTLLNVDSVLDERSPLRSDLAETLSELSAAARSIRAFAEYLERNPGALLRGKGSPGGR